MPCILADIDYELQSGIVRLMRTHNEKPRLLQIPDVFTDERINSTAADQYADLRSRLLDVGKTDDEAHEIALRSSTQTIHTMRRIRDQNAQ